jgi:putative membrane protein
MSMDQPADPPSDLDAVNRDASRRTYLANERTQLAWWRTGLTALAVALAIGRVVPELGHSSIQWPYTLVGAGFAVYGVALIVYGNIRSRDVMRALESGRFTDAPAGVITSLTGAGIALGVATLVLILID